MFLRVPGCIGPTQTNAVHTVPVVDVQPVKLHSVDLYLTFLAYLCPIHTARQTRQDSVVCVVSDGVN